MAQTDNTTTTTNSTTTDFAFTFPYLKTSDIKVSLDGTRTTDFTLANATTVRLDSAAGNGVKVRVFRETDDSALQSTFYAGSSIKASDLNDNFTQNLYSTQEVVGRYISNLAPSFQGDIDMNDSKVTELATPTAGTDAANKTYVDSAIDTALTSDISATGITITDNSPATGQIALSITDGGVTTDKLGTGAVTGVKIANDAIDSEHYAAGSIDLEHMSANSIDSAQYVDGSVDTEHLSADVIVAGKIADNAIQTEHLTTSVVSTVKIADNAVTATKIASNTITASEIADDAIGNGELADNAVAAANIQSDAVTTAKILNSNVTSGKLADDAVVAAKIANNAVTTLKLADAPLRTLSGMESGTASNLASNTALTATTTDLNNLTGKTVNSTLVAANTNDIPTSTAVNAHVVNLLNALGGFVAIADDQSFPTSNPDPEDNAGTVVSVADAGGLVIDSNGSTTTGRTTGSSTVTITGFPTVFRSKTLEAGLGVQVLTTATLNTYTYHKIIPTDEDTAQLTDDINNFHARYRVASSAPTSSLDEGDLWYDTATDKLKVYDSSASAWAEVASSGNFYINTISSYSGTGGNSATFNGTAYRFVLSNPGSNAQQHIVSINGVIQKPNTGTSQPGEGFAIDGSSILFSTAPPTGSDYFIITVGTAVSIGTPSDNTVATAKIQNLAVTTGKLADDAVTTAKIANGAVEAAQLGINAVIENNLTNNCVSTVKILDGNITTAKIAADAVDGTKIADDAVGAEHIEVLDGNLQFADNAKAQFGTTDNDLEIYHDASHSYLNHTGTGHFYIYGNGVNNIYLRANSSEESIIAKTNGAVELYYDGSKKFETYSTGVGVRGDAWIEGILYPWTDNNNDLGTAAYRWRDLYIANDIDIEDSGKLLLGNSDDLTLYHTGTHSYIDNMTGNLDIRSNALHLRDYANGHDYIKCVTDGAVELYWDNELRFETVDEGAKLTGYLFAHSNISDSAYTTQNRHVLQSDTGNNVSLAVEHSHDSNPYGIVVYFSDVTPDDNTHYFLHCSDSTGSKAKIYSDGDVWTSDAGTLTSDQTLKENITDATSKLEDLKKIKVRNFNWKSSFHPEKYKKKQIGFIAQEVETVFPALISEHDIAPGMPDDGHTPVMKKAIKDAWAPILVKALQEAITKIETLETKVAALEAK